MSMSKIAGALFGVIILAIITILIFKNFPIDMPSATQESASYEITAKRDLLALMMAYPENITGLEKQNDHTIYVIMQSGKKILYDDGKSKNYETKLANADLQDMMEQVYPLFDGSTNDCASLMEDCFDPGRIRVYAFLKDVYGGTQNETTGNLTSVFLASKNFPFNKNNNCADALKETFRQLSDLLKSNPNIYSYIYPVNGTYNYRVISGTGQLSPHAFGIAVDLKSNPSDYWKWATKEQGQKRLASYPIELVRVFENNHFIWGGKWAHFDILHFEYRPELIIKSKYYIDPNTSIEPWYSGYPDTDLTKTYISKIELAFQ